MTSIKEKDGKLISSVEIDLTNINSQLKSSDNDFFAGLVQSGFLTEDGDNASFTKSKEVARSNVDLQNKRNNKTKRLEQ